MNELLKSLYDISIDLHTTSWNSMIQKKLNEKSAVGLT